jgi:hypothetical protein
MREKGHPRPEKCSALGGWPLDTTNRYRPFDMDLGSVQANTKVASSVDADVDGIIVKASHRFDNSVSPLGERAISSFISNCIPQAEQHGMTRKLSKTAFPNCVSIPYLLSSILSRRCVERFSLRSCNGESRCYLPLTIDRSATVVSPPKLEVEVDDRDCRHRVIASRRAG